MKGKKRRRGALTEIDLDGNTAQWIWDHLVPASGQASSVQGELLRAVEKLAWEAQTNGNQNWDDGFKRLHSFLGETLLEEKELSRTTRAAVAKALKRLSVAKPATADQPYEVLTAAILEFCKVHPTVIKRKRDPALLR